MLCGHIAGEVGAPVGEVELGGSVGTLIETLGAVVVPGDGATAGAADVTGERIETADGSLARCCSDSGLKGIPTTLGDDCGYLDVNRAGAVLVGVGAS